MKKCKKLLSLTLALLVIVTSVPFSAVTAFGAGESLSLGDATDFDIDFNYYTNDPKKGFVGFKRLEGQCDKFINAQCN